MRETKAVCLTSYKIFLSLILAFGFGCGFVHGQESAEKQTVEPVFRVPKIGRRRGLIRDRLNSPQTQSQQPVTTETVPPKQNVVAVPPKNVTAPPVARVADAREIAPGTDKKIAELVPKEKIAPKTGIEHPLDRAVVLARTGLESMQQNIMDYTAVLVKRERVGDVLSDPELYQDQDP